MMAPLQPNTPRREWRGVNSSTRVYMQRDYELSDELQRKRIEVLENRYGGRSRAHHAATVIQRAFRDYRLKTRWDEIRQTQATRVVSIPRLSQANRIRSSSRQSSLASSSRYPPSISLSAQLRAARSCHISPSLSSPLANCANSIGGTTPLSATHGNNSPLLVNASRRSPPSPAPSTAHSHNHSRQISRNTTMIESLMSPRLSSRRFIPISCGGGIAEGRAEVWVPRSSLAHSNPAHSNSLPRLEKHVIERTNYNEASASTSHLPRFVTEQDRKRQYRIALNFFNKKPDRGVALLNAWGFVDETPESLARLLFGRRGLSKLMIGEYIGTLHSNFHSLVLKYFISLIDLRGLEVDVALRKSMQFFILPKEAEKIDRIIQAFAIHYAKCNPRRTEKFKGGWDTVHLVSFAIIMLNTDLHSPNLKQSMRMKKEDFVKNLKGQDKVSGEKEGLDIERSVLEGIYDRVLMDEIQAGDDHVAQVARVDRAILGKDKPRLTETQRRLVCYCRLQQVMDIAKKQSALSHERDVFLFNDMLVIAKSQNRKRTTIGGSYALKHWLVLLGASVHEFQRNQYEFGLTIISSNKEVLHFNARNNDDRCRFVADVRESIRECCEMENVRLELETEQLEVSRITVTENQRDSGLPDDTEEIPHEIRTKYGIPRIGLDRERAAVNGNSGGQSPSGSSSEGRSQPQNTTPSGQQLNNPMRRLSFNSLDSGVVEETYE